MLQGDPQNTSKRYAGRALPALLSEGWTIASTMAAGDGAYVVLTGGDVPMPDDVPDEPADPPGVQVTARVID